MAALAVAAVLYLPLAWGCRPRLRQAPFRSLLPLASITRLEGSLEENPVKNPSGFYRSRLAVFSAAGAAACSGAAGTVEVYLPASLVEAYYPGKAYTAAGAPLLAETGARLSLTGLFLQVPGSGGRPAFYAEAAESRGWAPGAAGRLAHVRACFRLLFKRLMYSWGASGGFVLALLSGAREYLEGPLASAFVAAGLSHILALSGFHIGLFSSFTRSLSRLLPARRLGQGAELFSVLAFIWFSGLSPSLLRALLCAALAALCAALHLRRPPLLILLSASFLLHAALFPSHVYQAAFVLSYGALGGIALLSFFLRRRAVRLFPFFLASPLADSAAAQLMTAPVSALLFSRVAWAGTFAALAVSPLVSLFMYAALAGVILSLLFPFLSPLVRAMIQGLYALIKLLVLFFARFPAVTFR